MLWNKNGALLFCLLTWLAVLFSGCSIDNHLQKVIKVTDPFASDDERDFIGMVVSFFSLPNGESTFIRFPNGKTMLIDTGSAEDWKSLQTLLTERNVTRIDYVVLTNDQPTQVGGYPSLEESLQLDAVILPRYMEPSIRKLIHLPPDKKLSLVAEGDRLRFDTNIVMSVLNPSEQMYLSPQDNSLVFQITQDQLRFFFTSTISERVEERLLEVHLPTLKAEVLKVADQGSNQASSQPFLDKVDPQIAIIQTGKQLDKLGTGQEEVVERLGESWAETYITSQHGTITILSNGKDYRVLKGKK